MSMIVRIPQTKRFQDNDGNKQIRWIISSAIGFFIVLIFWGIFQSFTTDRPEMEAYKCDNPACTRIHYRPISDANSNNVQN